MQKLNLILLKLMVVGLANAASYDSEILKDKPVLYLRLSAPSGAPTETDRSGHGNNGNYFPKNHSFQKTQLPNGEHATRFNGYTEYLEVPTSKKISLESGKALTIEAWIRPDTLQFPSQESDGYVHWAGKGESSEHEYVLRMYSYANSASRPNRISGYAFNLKGGLGSGSYFQDTIQAGKWIHIGVVIDMKRTPETISIYKNGVLRQKTPLSQFQVSPQPGNAPLRIGTRDMRSFFQGAIGKFAIYPYALKEAQLRAHYDRMLRR